MHDQILTPKMFSVFNGTITPEKSKSIANRVLVLQALSQNKFSIDSPGNSEDVKLMINALQGNTKEVNAGMAGTVLRFLTAGFSLLPGKRLLTGSKRLKQRPLAPLTSALQQLGSEIKFKEKPGFAPLEITGKPLSGGKIIIDASISSQFISALMLMGPFLKKGIEIGLMGKQVSNSYVKLTAGIMKQLGFSVDFREEKILIPPGKPENKLFKIEADWSAAAYWLAFIALVPHAEIRLQGLDRNSLQGDSEILKPLLDFGVITHWENGELKVKHQASVALPKLFKYDFTQMPDQAQTFAFLCAALGIDAELSGLKTLKGKETDRIAAIENELKKLGLNVVSDENSLKINGKITTKNASISTYNDHRMAMSGALIGTRIPVKIENPGVVAKSYPDFWKHLAMLTSEPAIEF